MDFLAFASAHGLRIGRLESGHIRRCPTEDHPRSDNGAYLFDGQWGWVQDWATMTEPAYWTDETITKPEDMAALRARMEASRKQHAQERAKDAAEAARKAAAIIKGAKADLHPYLEKKGFPESVGLVWEKDESRLLVVPMFIGSTIAGCQLIDRDGDKKFLKGQRTNGAEFVIGQTGMDIWCEGYATALSIHASLMAMKVQCRVHACFSAGNLQRMAKRGFVVADNDESKTGEKVAQATGLPYYMPSEKGWDFNDYHQSRGTFAAGMELRNFLNAKRARR